MHLSGGRGRNVKSLRLAAVGAVTLVLAGPAPALERLVFTVQGNDDLEQSLRNASLVAQAEAEEVTDPAELLAAARADYGRLVGALYAEGRYGGVISIKVDGREADAISPLAQLGRIGTISITVQPGPVYRFSRADIGPLAPETTLPDGYAVGEDARSGVIRDAAGVSIDAWRAVGYAKADIASQDVVAQHGDNRIASAIGVAPGPRVTFGDLILTGELTVRPERLRAIAGFPSGEVFDPDELDSVERRLRRTQVFSSVALVESDRLGPGDTMDVEADLVAFPPRRIGFGVEISSVDGATLTGYWLHRNLLGGAERFRVDAEVSGLGGQGGTDYSLGTRFERPATFSPENTAFVEARLERLNEPDFTSDTGTVGAGILRYVNDDLELEYGLAYRFSRVDDATGRTDYSLLTAPLSATYDTREEPLDAKSGLFLDLTATPFYGLNPQTGDGTRLTYDARTYLSFGAEDRFTVAGRVQGGSIVGADLLSVPNDYRFYSGGGGTVRGQAYQSLDVTLPGGIESGGGSFVGLSGELRAGITDSIGAVAFYDYGIVGRDSFPSSDSDSHAGAGLGLRYLTPIGPIRLDVAAPVSGGGSGVEVYIGIGQAF